MNKIQKKKKSQNLTYKNFFLRPQQHNHSQPDFEIAIQPSKRFDMRSIHYLLKAIRSVSL